MDVPICPVITACGGCPLMALTPEQERSSKLNVIERLNSRLGVTGTEPKLISCSRRIGYRNRIRLRIDELGQVAFFNAEKSSECAVLVPELREYVNHLRAWSAQHPRALMSFSHVEARTRDIDGHWGLFLTAKPEGEISRDALWHLTKSYDSQIIATSTDNPRPTQRFHIDGETFQRVPLDGFLQVNFEVNRCLTEHVVVEAKVRGDCTFADLYCGSGNFALPLARAGLTGSGVEFLASSVVSAQTGAREQNILGVSFHQGDTVDRVNGWLRSGISFDFVLIDPPRAGVRLGLEVIAGLARHSVAYCSCNPATLERDLLTLHQLGWQIDTLTGFDMFPGTRHLEVIAWLSH